MQNGLKRLRTAAVDPIAVTNGDISTADNNVQDFPPPPLPSNGTRNPQPSSQQQQKHPLFSRGVCTWAGCETNCDTYAEFMAHMNREHVLDERSTAQTRVQAEIVSNLQNQLKRETDRLEAMRAHLDPSMQRSSKSLQDNHSKDSTEQPVAAAAGASELTGAAAVHKMAQLESNFLAHSLSASGMQNLFGAKAAAAAVAFAGLTQPMADRNRLEDSVSKSKAQSS